MSPGPARSGSAACWWGGSRGLLRAAGPSVLSWALWEQVAAQFSGGSRRAGCQTSGLTSPR